MNPQISQISQILSPRRDLRRSLSHLWNLRIAFPARFASVFFVCAALGVLLATGGCTRETESRPPLKLVVPFGAGGGTDHFARIVKKAIEDNALLPVPVVIINIEGAGATIGSRRVKNARPDGNTALILHEAIITAKYSGKANYGPEAFEPVAGTGEVGMMITVREDSPYEDLNDLMQAAREQPGEVTFGANLGASTHFAGLKLEHERSGARFRFTQLGGGAKRFAALKGGHIDVTGFSIEEYLRYKPAGLRALAFFGPERHPAAPEIPTAQEQGFDIATTNMFFWWYPRGTPQKRIDELANALREAMQTDYVQQKMAEIHCDPVFIRGEELRKRIAAMTERVAKVAPRKSTSVPNFPAIVAGVIGCLAVMSGWQTWRDRRAEPVAQTADNAVPETRRTGLAALCIALTAAYVLVLDAGWAGFVPATTVFVLIAGAALSGLRPKSLLPLVAVALAMGFGLHAVLTRVFTVDLP